MYGISKVAHKAKNDTAPAMGGFPVWGKELSYKVKSCNVYKSSDSRSPGGRDHLIPVSSSHAASWS